jgi:hypothetical protein
MTLAGSSCRSAHTSRQLLSPDPHHTQFEHIASSQAKHAPRSGGSRGHGVAWLLLLLWLPVFGCRCSTRLLALIC